MDYKFCLHPAPLKTLLFFSILTIGFGAVAKEQTKAQISLESKLIVNQSARIIPSATSSKFDLSALERIKESYNQRLKSKAIENGPSGSGGGNIIEERVEFVKSILLALLEIQGPQFLAPECYQNISSIEPHTLRTQPKDPTIVQILTALTNLCDSEMAVKIKAILDAYLIAPEFIGFENLKLTSVDGLNNCRNHAKLIMNPFSGHLLLEVMSIGSDSHTVLCASDDVAYNRNFNSAQIEYQCLRDQDGTLMCNQKSTSKDQDFCISNLNSSTPPKSSIKFLPDSSIQVQFHWCELTPTPLVFKLNSLSKIYQEQPK